MAVSGEAVAAVTEYIAMLPPASTSLGDDGPAPPWIEEFVSTRVQAASARASMGWAVDQILRAAAARCVHCTVGAYLMPATATAAATADMPALASRCMVTDQLSCVVLPPIIQRIETTVAEREENRFEANQVRRAAVQAGAKMEGAKTQSRSKHFAKIENELRRQLHELEQLDSNHADAMEQLEPLRDFLRQLIRTRLEVDPARLQTDVDRMLSLGLNGKDLSMEGSGTILHTAAEAGQTDAIRGWLQHIAGRSHGDGSDSDRDDAQLVDARPAIDENCKGKRVVVVDESSPHFGIRGIVTAVSLRTGVVHVAFDDGVSSRMKVDDVRRNDHKTDADIESEQVCQLYAPSPVKHERLGAVHIDARSPNGATPLYAAAYAGHRDVVTLLLREKADVHATRDDGCTPMHAAARNGHCGVVEALIEGGADLSRPGKRGVTPLCMLAAALKRARLCAEAKDAQVADFAQRTAAAKATAGQPMSANEFCVGQAHMEEKAEALKTMNNLEHTLQQFLVVGRTVQRVRREAKRVFRECDKDHSGALSKTELNRLFDDRMEKRTDKPTRALAHYTDADGGIQWHNFWRWWWTQFQQGLWLPSTKPRTEQISEATELGYQAAFITESVEALWRERFYTGMIPMLEGMVAQARDHAKTAAARALAESEERQEKEYARQQADWQKRMQAANAETRRKRTAVWRTTDGQALLKTLQDAQAAEIISDKELDKLKMKVQSGCVDIVDLQQTWKRKWLLHCTRKGIASANSAPLVTKRKKRRPLFLNPGAESSAAKESAQTSAPWFDGERRMFGSIPEAAIALQVGLRPQQPDRYDRRRILTKGTQYLVDELHSQSSDNRALALWALAVRCGPNTTEGVKARRVVLSKRAVKQIARLLMYRGPRHSEVSLCGAAVLSTLVYEDKSVALIVKSVGCIEALVRLIEPDQHDDIRTSVLCCLVNLAIDFACRRECRRLDLARLVRPLCLKQNQVASIGLTLLDCLNEPLQLDPEAAKTQAEKDMLNSPEVTHARETLMSPSGSPILPSVRTSASCMSVVTSAGKPELKELTIELPFLINDFPCVDPCDIRRICERAGGITDAVLTRLSALNADEQGQQQNGGADTGLAADCAGVTVAHTGLAIDEPDTEIAQTHEEHDSEHTDSAWATESFAAFSFVDNLQAVKPTPKVKVPARPLHMLGGLFGNNATEHDLEETFNAFDENGDGVLSFKELKNGLLSLGVQLSSEEVEGIINLLDTDGNGEVDSREFCRQFQRWTGGQLSDEEQRTMRWHSKPTNLTRRSQMQTLRNVHSVKPAIDQTLTEDHINRIGQAIVAERDMRLAEVVAQDRKRIRAAVKQVHKVYQRSDHLAQESDNIKKQKTRDAEDARRGVRQFSRQEKKLLSEVQRAKKKLKDLADAASYGKRRSNSVEPRILNSLPVRNS